MYKFVCENMFSILLGIYLWVESLSPVVTLSWAHWETAKWFSKVDAPFIFLTAHPKFPFSPHPANTCYCHRCNNSPFSGCEVVSHCGFDLHFPNNWWCGTSFHVLIGHFYMFFAELSIQILCPFFNWVVCVFDVKLYVFFVYFGY